MYWWIYLLVCVVVGAAFGLRSAMRHRQPDLPAHNNQDTDSHD